MKAVFDTKADSVYDDDIAHRYNFPSQYLNIVSQCVGDWIVYREPRARGGSMAYFAVAQILRVEKDPAVERFYYAIVGNFLPFDNLVPWRPDGRYFEGALRNLETVAQVGVSIRGRSVRPLEDEDFVDIVEMGLSDTLNPANAIPYGLDPSDVDIGPLITPGFSEPSPRRVIQTLLNRKVREASFRRNVCLAYDNRCAVTRLRIINGGGRAEAQAAHIWPVSDGGPDTVPNGIALSGTAHWLFDRHLISLRDDYSLLVSHNKIPEELRTLFRPQMDKIHLPTDRRLWPNLTYVARHRDIFASR